VQDNGGIHQEPADSAADIHDSGAALDRASNLPKRWHAQPQAPHKPAADAIGHGEPAQQPAAAAAYAERPSADILRGTSDAAEAADEEQLEEISPAQGANFTEVKVISSVNALSVPACSAHTTGSEQETRRVVNPTGWCLSSGMSCQIVHRSFSHLLRPVPGRLAGGITQGCHLCAQAQKQQYEKQDLEGVPWDVYERGPPLPPCNKVRAYNL